MSIPISNGSAGVEHNFYAISPSQFGVLSQMGLNETAKNFWRDQEVLLGSHIVSHHKDVDSAAYRLETPLIYVQVEVGYLFE